MFRRFKLQGRRQRNLALSDEGQMQQHLHQLQQEQQQQQQQQQQKQLQQEREKREKELRAQEEEELQLAIALSQSEEEEEAKKKGGGGTGAGAGAGGGGAEREKAEEERDLLMALEMSRLETENKRMRENGGRGAEVSESTVALNHADEGLSKYLDRGQWEERARALGIRTCNAVAKMGPIDEDEESAATKEQVEFVAHLASGVETFVNRMKSDSARGRSVAGDSAVQTLFMSLSQMHPRLLSLAQSFEEKRAKYESLQDKLSQLREAREALVLLEEEFEERRRREAAEVERRRQSLMAQKLQDLRKKKQEMIEEQRMISLQRLQRQEQEFVLKQQQLKQYYAQQNVPPWGGIAAPPSLTEARLSPIGAASVDPESTNNSRFLFPNAPWIYPEMTTPTVAAPSLSTGVALGANWPPQQKTPLPPSQDRQDGLIQPSREIQQFHAEFSVKPTEQQKLPLQLSTQRPLSPTKEENVSFVTTTLTNPALPNFFPSNRLEIGGPRQNFLQQQPQLENQQSLQQQHPPNLMDYENWAIYGNDPEENHVPSELLRLNLADQPRLDSSLQEAFQPPRSSTPSIEKESSELPVSYLPTSTTLCSLRKIENHNLDI